MKVQYFTEEVFLFWNQNREKTHIKSSLSSIQNTGKLLLGGNQFYA
jgi:hypothetical protein